MICDTNSARQEHTGRVRTQGVRRVHKLLYRWYEKYVPGAHESSKDLRRAKSAQAASKAVQVERARSTRVEKRLEACEECTRTPESLTPRPGKGRCAAKASSENLTESVTQRLTASWRAGTQPSSRHHRTCFARFQSSPRRKIWYRRRRMSTTTLWTTTKYRTTTYCGT